MKKILNILILLCFFLSTINISFVSAAASPFDAIALMSKPGVQVNLSQTYNSSFLKGMVIDPKDPFKFDFLIFRGDTALNEEQKKSEYSKLIKYFLAALAVPDTDQWVNLSPFEKDRITSDSFGQTIMGRDLLAQDYLLKQIASSLTNPEKTLGKKFWDAVYAKAYQELGTTNIPVKTFNKVWIVPDKAVVYEKGNTVYVVESHLKVMTDADYLSMKKHGTIKQTKQEIISNQVMRDIVIPAIEKEVNEGKNFAPLRQVFSGMLLATWYKKSLKESILGKLYANQGKIKGVDQDSKTNQLIYEQYLKAYRKGVFNMIKEDVDQVTKKVIPRKYFSGGLKNDFLDKFKNANPAMGAQAFAATSPRLDLAQIALKDTDSAMKSKSVIKKVTNSIKGAVIGLSLLSATFLNAQSPDVTLMWDPSPDPDVTTYTLHYGQVSGSYTNHVDVGNVTNYTFKDLPFGATIYFVVTAKNSQGLESDPSNEVTFYTIQSADGTRVTFTNNITRISWNPIPQAPTNTTYTVYAGLDPDLMQLRLPAGTNNFLNLTNFPSGAWYFAVTASLKDATNFQSRLRFRNIENTNTTLGVSTSIKVVENTTLDLGYYVQNGGTNITYTYQTGEFEQLIDEFGNLVFDTNGFPVYRQEVDELGNPEFDQFVNPIYVEIVITFKYFIPYYVWFPRLETFTSVVLEVKSSNDLPLYGLKYISASPSTDGPWTIVGSVYFAGENKLEHTIAGLGPTHFFKITDAAPSGNKGVAKMTQQQADAFVEEVEKGKIYTPFVQLNEPKLHFINKNVFSFRGQGISVENIPVDILNAPGSEFTLTPEGISIENLPKINLDRIVAFMDGISAKAKPSKSNKDPILQGMPDKFRKALEVPGKRKIAGFSYKEPTQKTRKQFDKASIAIKSQETRGGIDFAESNLDLQIRRDGKGVPFPISQQNLEQIKINGLVPIILNIQPAPRDINAL